MDSAEGAYRVRTLTALYIIDLDSMTLLREPAAEDASKMPHDTEPVVLIAVLACTVGDRMQLIVDFHTEGMPFTRQTSSYVLSIERIETP